MNDLELWAKQNMYMAHSESGEVPTVAGDVLYAKLGMDPSNYVAWDKRVKKNANLVKERDFKQFSLRPTKTSPKGGRPKKVTYFTLEAAIKVVALSCPNPIALQLLDVMTRLFRRYMDGDITLIQEIANRLPTDEERGEVAKSVMDTIRNPDVLMSVADRGIRNAIHRQMVAGVPVEEIEQWYDGRMRQRLTWAYLHETIDTRGANHAQVTNEIYTGLGHKPAYVHKPLLGLKGKETIRDYLDTERNLEVQLSEERLRKEVVKRNLKGRQIAAVANNIASFIRKSRGQFEP